MPPIRLETWTKERLRVFAHGYLAQVHPTDSLPIPIEDFVELHHKIDVVPVERLMASGHEAYTSRDRTTIYIDKGIYEREDPNRRRSTLAHELAHLLIHGPIFEAATFSNMAEFSAFITSLADRSLKQIENEAFDLANLLLVPPNHLSAEYAKIEVMVRDQGLDIRDLEPQSMRLLAKKLGDIFQVSHQIVHRAAVRDGLWAWDALPPRS